MIEFKALRFISETIQVEFRRPPTVEKTPHCPDRFIFGDETYQVTELIRQWQDFERRGAMGHNMRPSSMKKAIRRGSYGVGRFYFLVRTEDERYFELYFDRAVQSVDQRKGQWILFREVAPTDIE
ncbi:MAG: hypothetical protein H8E28_02210 [Anaerolineae bacterium]|nr:hypothetical protein [Anaerolineae bacterium]MBL6965673.1 hypothetical protein [Anaerolineales bacterium]